MTPQKARDILEYEFPNVSVFIEHTYARYGHRKQDGWVLEHRVSLVDSSLPSGRNCEAVKGQNLHTCVQGMVNHPEAQKWRRTQPAPDPEPSEMDRDLMASSQPALAAQPF